MAFPQSCRDNARVSGQRKFRYTTVTAVVIANMVGTGVFTSLGFQLLEIDSGFVLLLLATVSRLSRVWRFLFPAATTEVSDAR